MSAGGVTAGAGARLPAKNRVSVIAPLSPRSPKAKLCCDSVAGFARSSSGPPRWTPVRSRARCPGLVVGRHGVAVQREGEAARRLEGDIGAALHLEAGRLQHPVQHEVLTDVW